MMMMEEFLREELNIFHSIFNQDTFHWIWKYTFFILSPSPQTPPFIFYHRNEMAFWQKNRWKKKREGKKLLIKIPSLLNLSCSFFPFVFFSFQILLRKPDEIISLRSPPKAKTPPSTTSSSSAETQKGKYERKNLQRARRQPEGKKLIKNMFIEVNTISFSLLLL